MRRAFTLIELLITMAIVALLAGITIPIIGIVRRQAKDVQCLNNLQQISAGILGFRTDNNQAFPEELGLLFAPGAALNGVSKRILICPFDGSKGMDPIVGRTGERWSDLTRLHEADCSFLFESSGKLLQSPEIDWKFDENLSPTWGYDNPGSGPQTRKTWWEAKAYQLKHGNLGNTAFSESDFPVIRCFYHQNWTKVSITSTVKRVAMLAWDGSTSWTIPYWEHQANPSIPFPPD